MNIEDRLKEIKEIKKELSAKVRQTFVDGLEEILKEHSKLRSVSWTQYTPYFNDGEPCYFGVHKYDIQINEDSIWEKVSSLEKELETAISGAKKAGVDPDDAPRVKELKEKIEKLSPPELSDKEEKKIRETIRGYLGAFDDGEFMTMFGDHVKVVVSKNEDNTPVIEVEEYSDHY